jgi:hypothetical protein
MASGLMGSKMVMDNLHIKMVAFMMVSGLMISEMVKE